MALSASRVSASAPSRGAFPQPWQVGHSIRTGFISSGETISRLNRGQHFSSRSSVFLFTDRSQFSVRKFFDPEIISTCNGVFTYRITPDNTPTWKPAALALMTNHRIFNALAGDVGQLLHRKMPQCRPLPTPASALRIFSRLKLGCAFPERSASRRDSLLR